MLKNRDISNNNSQFCKHALTDASCYCKMTSVLALDSVRSFSRWKDVTNTYNRMRHSLTIGGFPQCNGGRFDEA